MNEIWKKNREKLLARMEMFSAAVLFAGKAPIKRGDENYPFSPDRNFYYVTGIEREDCILFLAKTRTGVEETLYIPRDNGVMAKWVGANMTAEEATAASGVENIGWIDAFEEDFATYLFRSGIKKIWLDMARGTYPCFAVCGEGTLPCTADGHWGFVSSVQRYASD